MPVQSDTKRHQNVSLLMTETGEEIRRGPSGPRRNGMSTQSH